MAGPTAQSRLKQGAPSFHIDFATTADDAGLRRLLRETPMPGAIQVSLEREPSYFAAAQAEGGRHYTVCARDAATGEIIAMGSRSVRELYVNGIPQLVGYLSQLRVAPSCRHLSRSLVRRGFALLRETHALDEAPFDITTIVAGNDTARRLLEAGLPELPRYTPVERIWTMLLPVRGSAQPPVAPLRIADEPAPCPRQFSPVESCPGPVWDQRAIKQIVVRGYSPWLRRCRWLLRLPPVGSVLPVAYLTRFPFTADDFTTARPQGCRWLAFGLSARHPLAEVVRKRYRPAVYESTLYIVHDLGTTVALDGRISQVEVALL
jgi:hypothetical protein